MTDAVLEFWFEFDDAFKWHPADDILDAFVDADAPVGITHEWHRDRDAGTYPAGFTAAMEAVADSVVLLATRQLAIIDEHFTGDRVAERTAFEEFAMGIHFDDRRPAGDKVHKMNTNAPGGATNGYHDWHAFARAAVLVGEDADRWLGIDRNIGLAWAIQTILKPRDDATDNPRLAHDRVERLRAIWLAMSVDELDDAFDTQPVPADALLAPGA